MTRIDAQTRLAGAIGWPIAHSLSPMMQNAAIEALGVKMVYVALAVEPDALGAAVRGAAAMGFVGLNVTIPHKETALEFLDEIEPTAAAIGAVNTIHFTEAGAVGHNTDAYGFTQTVMAEGEWMFRDLTALIVGGGGAARAMAAGAAAEGATKVILANRTRKRAEKIAADLGPRFPETRWEVVQASDSSLRNAIERSQLLANATSLGMKPDDPPPLPLDAIQPEHLVFDAVYAPAETPLLAAARGAGAIAIGGMGMLARQGARALAIWTGLEPDEELMLDALRQHLRAEEGVP